MLFLSRSLGGLVRPRSPPLGSGKVVVRPNPGRGGVFFCIMGLLTTTTPTTFPAAAVQLPTVGGQNLEKRIEQKCWENSGMSCGAVGEWRCPRPPISMLVLPVRQVPFLQTFVLSGTNLGGGPPNIEIGGRGTVLPENKKAPPRDLLFFSPNIVLLQYLASFSNQMI